jgi:hypothetical protein
VVAQAHSRTTGAGHRTRHGHLPAPRPAPRRPGLCRRLRRQGPARAAPPGHRHHQAAG